MQDILISIIFACMIVFPFFMSSLARTKNPRRREEALNKAIAKGHVVTAILKKRYGSVDDPFSHSARGMVGLGIYEYEYKGRMYKYKLYDDYLPTTVKLYFVKNPRKAEEAAAVGTSETACWPIIITIISFVIYVIGRFSA